MPTDWTRPGGPPAKETDLIWRQIEQDRASTGNRFDRLEGQVEQVDSKVTSVAGDISIIKHAEAQRAESASKRDQRIWQVFSGVLVGVAIAVVIALFKACVPVMASKALTNPTINEQIDRGDFDPARHQ